MRDPKAGKGKMFWVGVSSVILFMLSTGAFVLFLFVVPKFQQIYADALPGKPLPQITNLIIEGHLLLAACSPFWMILTGFLVLKQRPSAMLWFNIGIIWNLLLIGIVVVALFMPMVGIEVGMSEAKP